MCGKFTRQNSQWVLIQDKINKRIIQKIGREKENVLEHTCHSHVSIGFALINGVHHLIWAANKALSATLHMKIKRETMSDPYLSFNLFNTTYHTSFLP